MVTAEPTMITAVQAASLHLASATAVTRRREAISSITLDIPTFVDRGQVEALLSFPLYVFFQAACWLGLHLLRLYALGFYFTEEQSRVS